MRERTTSKARGVVMVNLLEHNLWRVSALSSAARRPFQATFNQVSMGAAAWGTLVPAEEGIIGHDEDVVSYKRHISEAEEGM